MHSHATARSERPCPQPRVICKQRIPVARGALTGSVADAAATATAPPELPGVATGAVGIVPRESVHLKKPSVKHQSLHSRAKPSGADSTLTTGQALPSRTPAPQPAHNNVLPLEGPARAAAHEEPRTRPTRPSPGQLHLQPQQHPLPPADTSAPAPAPGLQLQQLLDKYPLPPRTTPSRKAADPTPSPGPSSPSSSSRAPAAYATPHDPLGTRFWEARLLSRSCTSVCACPNYSAPRAVQLPSVQGPVRPRPVSPLTVIR